jgi:FtsP/CotA-like multicopper oxidase with cupredoxin domain
MTKTTRREFLRTAGATLTMLALPARGPRGSGAGPEGSAARPAQLKLRPSGAATGVWGFNGSVPGPVLRYPQGADLALSVRERAAAGDHRALARPARVRTPWTACPR